MIPRKTIANIKVVIELYSISQSKPIILVKQVMSKWFLWK